MPSLDVSEDYVTTDRERSGKSMILCPVCKEPSTVKPGGVGHRLANGELPRTRVCSNLPSHEFRTYERAQNTRLEQVAIRQGAGQGLRPFDRTRLTDDVERFLRGVLTREDVGTIVSAAVDWLTYNLDGLVKPIQDRKRAGEDFSHFIGDNDVRSAVSRALITFGRENGDSGSRHRVAYVLYAMATEGATKYRATGWASAEDVIKCIELAYPEIEKRRAPEFRIGQAEERWWAPAAQPPTMPEVVIKKPQSGGPHRAREQPFDRARFERSLESVLVGRAATRPIALQVAQWTLWGLVGQSVVLSTQLSAAVADCLRRVDDIGYLRWVAIAKGLTVSQIYAEAVGLAEHPAVRLTFDRTHPALIARRPAASLRETSDVVTLPEIKANR
jgi:transcriptional regulator NrdR family protein